MSKHRQQLLSAVLGFALIGLPGYRTLAKVELIQPQAQQEVRVQAATPDAKGAPQLFAISKVQPTQIIKWIKQNKPLTTGGLSIVIVITLYLTALGLRPTWLLWLPSELQIPKTSIKLPLGLLLWLKYQPRVLDAWVVERIQQAQETFEERPTVRERKVHIPIPVKLNGNESAIASLSAKDLQAVFARQSFRLLILGEGGVGKTSLACQIATWSMAKDKTQHLCKHRMLPVLIEEELEASEGKSPLIEAIARQVKNLRDDEKPISEELLKQLLEKRRILVIVDHFSEMSEATRKAIRLRDSSSPVNALVVTSRIADILGKEVTHTTLQPLRVSSDGLGEFLHEYLIQQGKRHLFDVREYCDALLHLSQIVTDKRDVTVLFAKLYADQMIAIAEGSTIESLPDNVPDLMLGYINELNRNVTEGKLEDEIIQRDAKVVAWECLKQSFKPEPADREQIINSLAALEGEGETAKEGARKRLKYLEDRLALIRSVPPNIKVRFALDPLAEYLAGLYLIQLYGEDEQRWKAFLDEARNKPETLEEIQGFLLALRDCCIAKRKEVKISNFVIEELGKIAGLDLEALSQEQLQRRIRDLASDLSRTDPRDRAYAANELGKIGSEAKAAVPSLITRVLQDDNVSVRRASVAALGKIGLRAESDYLSLSKAFNDSDEEVCVRAIELLAIPTIATELLIPALIDALKRIDFPKDEQGRGYRRIHIRLGSSYNAILQALIRGGSAVVPYLCEILRDQNLGIRDTAMSVLGVFGEFGKLEPYGIVATIALMQALNSNDVDDRRNACYALQGVCLIDRLLKFAAPDLTKFLDDTDELVCTLVARILVRVNSQTAMLLIPRLISALESKDTNVRCYASIALGDAGLAAQEAIPWLEAVSNDSTESVRQAAQEALRKIRTSESAA